MSQIIMSFIFFVSIVCLSGFAVGFPLGRWYQKQIHKEKCAEQKSIRESAEKARME